MGWCCVQLASITQGSTFLLGKQQSNRTTKVTVLVVTAMPDGIQKHAWEAGTFLGVLVQPGLHSNF